MADRSTGWNVPSMPVLRGGETTPAEGRLVTRWRCNVCGFVGTWQETLPHASTKNGCGMIHAVRVRLGEEETR